MADNSGLLGTQVPDRQSPGTTKDKIYPLPCSVQELRLIDPPFEFQGATLYNYLLESIKSIKNPHHFKNVPRNL